MVSPENVVVPGDSNGKRTDTAIANAAWCAANATPVSHSSVRPTYWVTAGYVYNYRSLPDMEALCMECSTSVVNRQFTFCSMNNMLQCKLFR